MIHNSNVSLIILAGGKSERMGLPKTWLKLNDERSFAEHILSCYQQVLLDECVLVLNGKHRNKMEENKLNPYLANLKVVSNSFPDNGRLFSIKHGINNLTTDYVFIHNIDQPYIDVKTLELMMKYKEDDTVVVPRHESRGGHPVLIGKQIVNEIKEHYTKYDTLKEVFANFTIKYIDVDTPDVLTNINTPEELGLYQQL